MWINFLAKLSENKFPRLIVIKLNIKRNDWDDCSRSTFYMVDLCHPQRL